MMSTWFSGEAPRGPVLWSCFSALLMFFYAGPKGSLSSTVRYWDARSDLELVAVDGRGGTGDVFVAGTNFVFRLDRSLMQLKGSRKIGPPPSASCRRGSAGDCSAVDPRTVNHARILEIIPEYEDRLLLCGSDRNGLCSAVEMETLNIIEFNSSNAVNHAGGRRSVFGFFSKSTTGGVFYVANSFDGRPHDLWSGAISARILKNLPNSMSFEFSFYCQRHNLTSSVAITLSQMSNYIVRYIYGFEYKGFTFFLTVQRQSLIPDTEYEPRLVRVCQKDDGFNSYTELGLSCQRRGAMFYNIPLAAYLSTTEIDPRPSSRLNPGKMALFVMFGKSGIHGPEAVESHGSALCVYSMNEIMKEFAKVQVDCYRGIGRILPWINQDEPKCSQNVDIAKMINDSFCGNSLNVGIGGRYPLRNFTSFTTSTHLATGIRTMTVRNKTVAVIGTTSGQLMKVVVDGTDRDPYSVIDVGVGSSIRSDMEFDASEENIYVLSGKRISLVPLKTCSIYSDCSTCITSGDPLNCGWCDDHCSSRAECIAEWLTGHCPPVIHSFNPRSGPVEGGTAVTIRGRNFGNGNWSESFANVKVANNLECLIEHRNGSCIICTTKSSSVPLDREFRVWVSDPSKTTVNFKILGLSISSYDSFSYKVASITNINPLIGPVSGSTNLAITGSNLDIGSNLTVTVWGKLCNITRVTPSQILCLTSPFYQNNLNWSKGMTTEKGFVAVTIDNAAVTQGHFEYIYSEDPVIFNIFPNRSILSGGMNLTVVGKNLNSVSQPRIVVNPANEEAMYNDSCQSSSDGTQMICLSPGLSNISRELEPTQRLTVDMRFSMDGVKELWDFPSTHPNLSRILYSMNPEIFLYRKDESEDEEQANQLLLKLQGQNLNLSASSNDYSVTVGGFPCNVTQLTMTDLFCHLPESSVLAPHEIVVTVGNLRFVPGHLRPSGEAIAQGQGLSIGMPLTISVALVVVVVVIVCILWLTIWRRTLFKRKCQTVPNVLYTAGSQLDLMANRVSETATWLNPIPNSYLSHSEAVRHRVAHHSDCRAREPILDEESRRLLNDSNLLISRDCLLLLEIIGQGHFGCVFRGFLKVGAKDEMEVAVKTLKNSVYMNIVESKKFLDEALTMRDFNHIHVLKLIGIVIDKELPLVVLPFMRHGDLLSYLRNELNSPTVRELMVFGQQIADGMNYLANLKFVHRDLAARNCMLDDDMMVKVADFGLSRDIYERDYYSSDDRKAKLPVKWMALESLEKGIYSTKTDVWSFGVVLWELLTRGVSPYPEVDNWDIIRYLKNGRRMPQPSYCPNSLYSVMLNCWNPDHSLRPTFEELAKTIRSIIGKMEDVQHPVRLNVTYVNAGVQGNGYLRPVDSRFCDEAGSASETQNSPLNYLSFASSQSTLV